MSQQTARVVVVGMTGGGKSYLIRELIEEFRAAGTYRQLVIVNRKREFADLCEKAFTVEEDGDPAEALERYPSIFFHVTGYDPRPFLDNLGAAAMTLNDDGTPKHPKILFVFDESYEFWARGRVARALYRVLTGGRDPYGHNAIFGTQMLQSAGGGIDLGVLQQASHLCVLRLQGEYDTARAKSLFPELGDRATQLKRPGDDGTAPDLAVRNMLTGEAMLRTSPAPGVYKWENLQNAA